MAKNRRVIRKVTPPGQLVIDEQFWPVILAMFVLCGFLMGTVAAYFPWQGIGWWNSAATWLFVIPLVTCVVIWGLRYLPSRVVRRTLQVSVVLCLLIHVALLVISLEARIFGRLMDQMARSQPRRTPRDQRIVNDYHPHQLEQHQRAQQDFVKPVETTVPDPEEERVERQEPQPERPDVQPQPMPQPERQRDLQRSPIERPMPAQTRPRQSEQPSRLSRQRVELKPQASEPVRAPATAAAEARPSALEAQTENVRQQPATTAASRAQTSAETQAAAQDAPRLARQQTERAPTIETRSAATLPRQVAQAGATPRAETQVNNAPSISRQTSPTELQPARRATRQQVTASAPQLATSAPSEPVISRPQTPAPRRESPSPVQPQLAQTPAPVANQNPRATTRPSPASSAAVARAAAPANPSESALDAAASTVRPTQSSNAARAASGPSASANPSATAVNDAARRAADQAATTAVTATEPTAMPRAAVATNRATTSTTAAATAAATGQEASAARSLTGAESTLPRQLSIVSAAGAAANANAPSSSPAVTSVATTGERAPSSSASTPDGASGSVNHLQRTERTAAVATATAPAEAPRHVAADTGSDQPQASPSRLAMTQSLSGVAGVGQSPNLDRSPSTPGSPATTASGAARRAEATQNVPTGPALAPSSAALARRSLVGAERPTASLRATTSAVAEAAGAAQPSELNASAGAAVVQQSANAQRGDVTAAKGSFDVDLGPTRVADAGGFERASGGGQPEIQTDQGLASPARTKIGGPAPTAIATTQVDVTAAALAGSAAEAQSQLAAAGLAMEKQESTGPAAAAGANPNAASAGSQATAPETLAASQPTRADNPSDLPTAGTSAAEAAIDEEEEERRRLARLAARSGPVGTTDAPVAAAATSESSAVAASAAGASPEMQGTTGEIARQEPQSNGAPGTAELAAAAPVVGGDVVGAPSLQRAEAADAVEGPVVTGGGTAGTERSSTPREFAANVTAELPNMAGAPDSSGSPRGIDAVAEGGSPSPTATGSVTRTSPLTIGAVASAAVTDATTTAGLDAVPGPAARSSTAGDAPVVGEATASAAPLARSTRTQFNAGPTTAAVVGVPAAAPSTAAADTALAEASSGTAGSRLGQQSAAALPVNVEAPEGVGGFSGQLAMNVGVNNLMSSPDAVTVQSAPSRFLRQDVGGAPQLNTAAIFAADAFRNRNTGRRDAPMPGGGGAAGPQTEEAIELGLAFLVRRQLSDGSWTLRSTTEPAQLASDTAATGLCLLAFQGAGYNHREYKYAAQLNAAVEYLIKNQKPDGDLFVPLDDISNRSVWLYSHGIAALALCEAYGMTQDPRLRDPAQRALDYIVASQDPQGGGWRYQPGVESDTSVTGWMMMALKSGELAGLTVPRSTYDHIGRWLNAAQGSAAERHLYRYNPHAPDTPTQRHGRSPTPTMTAVGLLMRLYGGWRRDHPAMLAGADYLRQNPPSIGTLRDPQRDTYYWYYGTQVMFHMGGALWEEWNGELYPLLINSQMKQGELAGSWSPSRPLPDRWAPQGGRIYVTTLNLLSLEVTYRHLPLYVDTAK